MNILITGGSGFLGENLTSNLNSDNMVTILDRNIKTQIAKKNTEYIQADLSKPGEWQKLIPKQDVIINLAGTNIFKRWNTKTKEAILNSRILTTRNIVDSLKSKKTKKTTLLSASAVGYYGFHSDTIIDESFPPGSDFLAGVACKWEEEANRAMEYGVRVVNCRFGIILGKDGGALKMMIPIFNSFMGGRLGNGKQWFPWIHERDLLNIFIYLIKNKKIEGPVNCTSPNPVTNRELTVELQKILNRPSLIPFIPSFLMRIFLGEFGNLILKGQRGIPKKLLDHGFVFKYPNISSALYDIIQ